ncbi:MAG: hypothetical protein ABIR68_07790, partial [Ilumatobacteraceae bacterium]
MPGAGATSDGRSVRAGAGPDVPDATDDGREAALADGVDPADRVDPAAAAADIRRIASAAALTVVVNGSTSVAPPRLVGVAATERWTAPTRRRTPTVRSGGEVAAARRTTIARWPAPKGPSSPTGNDADPAVRGDAPTDRDAGAGESHDGETDRGSLTRRCTSRGSADGAADPGADVARVGVDAASAATVAVVAVAAGRVPPEVEIDAGAGPSNDGDRGPACDGPTS